MILQCLACERSFPRPRIGRPPLRCEPCREKHQNAKTRERVLRWAAKQV